MNNRAYNILFHTHTISGICISLALYVIFFAGSFSFFRDEIVSWERNEPLSEDWGLGKTDFDLVLDTLDQRKGLKGWDVSFNQYYDEQRTSVSFSPPPGVKVERQGRRGNFIYLNTQNLKSYDYQNSYSLGEFLYRLHFFAQLNLWGRSGYLLAGIVAFFFLFAVITGVVVHWNKIVSNFYLFRPYNSLKNLWTDAHTGLGILGLPYQFMFALTGVYLIVGFSIMSPPVLSFAYGGDQEKLNEEFEFNQPKFEPAGKPLEGSASVNALIEKTLALWPEMVIRHVNVFNYGDQNMHVKVEGHPSFSSKFAGLGNVVYHAASGEVVSKKELMQDTSFYNGARATMIRLHFGDFGGLGLKLIYFGLGILSCFVIISGVLIWQVARDKKHIDPAKRKFNAWLTWFYLAAALGMYPVTAFTFLAVKIGLNPEDVGRMTFIFQMFFWSWLAVTLLLTFLRDNWLTNRLCLISGGMMGILIPVANGIKTGNWFWESWALGYGDVFLIDVFWLGLGIISLWIGGRLKRKSVPKPVEKIEREALLR
jgi:uncharacterized iron-regulated membrane protein